MGKFADFLEKDIADALDAIRIRWVHESEKMIGADFYLPDYNIYIEIKQYHSERAIKQLKDKNDAILIQGKSAVAFFIKMLKNE